jgi:hypothetical protein
VKKIGADIAFVFLFHPQTEQLQWGNNIFYSKYSCLPKNPVAQPTIAQHGQGEGREQKAPSTCPAKDSKVSLPEGSGSCHLGEES